MSFQTSNSGAFRSLHCLIYKVLAPFRVRCGTFTILPQVFRFVKYFFRLFSKSFFVPGSPEPVARKLGYFTTSSRACQVLFSTFSKIFFVLTRRRASRSKAWLVYHSSQLLSSPFFTFLKAFSKLRFLRPLRWQLAYSTRFLPLCQYPFWSFFQIFLLVYQRHFASFVI